MLKLARRARGHFVTLIEIRVHLIRVKPGHISRLQGQQVVLVDSYFIYFLIFWFVLNILTRIRTILLTVFTIKQLPVLEISQL